MIRLVVIHSQPGLNLGSEIVGDPPVFQIVGTFSTTTLQELTRNLPTLDPELILLDVSQFDTALELVQKIRSLTRNAAMLGFGARLREDQQLALEQAGIGGILREPFSSSDLDEAARWALHQLHPLDHPNVLAFLPSKAGSGCTTTVLNTAACIANEVGKRTLLIEGDRRSGVLSVTLDVEARGGLPAILSGAGKLSPVEWRQHVETIGKLDLLLANPLRPGPQPTWATYFHIFKFVKNQYDVILVDLPELINPATTELALAARAVFIVCEPELASLRLVQVRRVELEAAGVQGPKISVLANRWESKRLTKEALEKITQTPMYAALPNDYQEVKNAAMESRLVSKSSAFAKACSALARRIIGAPQAAPEGPVAQLLRRFGKE